MIEIFNYFDNNIAPGFVYIYQPMYQDMVENGLVPFDLHHKTWFKYLNAYAKSKGLFVDSDYDYNRLISYFGIFPNKRMYPGQHIKCFFKYYGKRQFNKSIEQSNDQSFPELLDTREQCS